MGHSRGAEIGHCCKPIVTPGIERWEMILLEQMTGRRADAALRAWLDHNTDAKKAGIIWFCRYTGKGDVWELGRVVT